MLLFLFGLRPHITRLSPYFFASAISTISIALGTDVVQEKMRHSSAIVMKELVRSCWKTTETAQMMTSTLVLIPWTEMTQVVPLWLQLWPSWEPLPSLLPPFLVCNHGQVARNKASKVYHVVCWNKNKRNKIKIPYSYCIFDFRRFRSYDSRWRDETR